MKKKKKKKKKDKKTCKYPIYNQLKTQQAKLKQTGIIYKSI